MKFFSALALLAVVSDAKKGKKEGPTSKSMTPSSKKKRTGQCALPKDDVLEAALLGVFSTLAASPCALETAKALCSGVTSALDRCNDERLGKALVWSAESCFCELAPSELVESFDVELCATELVTFSSTREPSLKDELFRLAILGFALTEAILLPPERLSVIDYFVTP